MSTDLHSDRAAGTASRATPRRERRLGALRASPRAQTVAAMLLYAAYALFVTWPLALDLDGSIFGGVGGDLTGTIAHVREQVEERIFPFAPGTLHDFDAPFGEPEQWVFNIVSLPSTALMVGLAHV